jgi:hypothetical protein
VGAWLYRWDVSILEFLNHFSRHSWLFDQVVSAFEGEALLKGGVLTAFLWWGWFRDSSKKEVERAILIAGTFSAIASLAVCRVLAPSFLTGSAPSSSPSSTFCSRSV